MAPTINYRHSCSVLIPSLFIVFTSFAQEPSWNDNLNMPVKRWGSLSCELNGKIYILGGGEILLGGQAKRTVYMYDPDLNTWISKSDLTSSKGGFAASAYNNRIYVFGGAPYFEAPLNTVEMYDPGQDKWTTLKKMPVAQASLSSCIVNDSIYILGGSDANGEPFGRVDIYDPATDTWALGTSMTTRRTAMAAVVLDDKIYSIGGHKGSANNETGVSTVEMYDPATDTWTTKAELITPKKLLSACSIDGRIYVFGGAKGYCTNYPIQNIEEYNPETDTWTEIYTMPQNLYIQSATSYNGKIYLAGGAGGASCDDLYSVSTFYEFIPYREGFPVIDEFKLSSISVYPGNGDLVISTKTDAQTTRILAEIEAPDSNPVDTLQLFDDGNHQDGAAGDHVFANSLTVEEEQNYTVDLHLKRDSDSIIYYFNNLGRFTSFGPIVFDTFTYATGVTIPNPGSELKLKIYLKNNGFVLGPPDLKVVLSCSDTTVYVANGEQSFGTIAAGQSKTHLFPFQLNIPDDYSESSITLDLDISSEGFSYWRDSFSIEVFGVGITETSEGASFRMYPNPSDGFITVETSSEYGTLEVYNLIGKKMMHKNIQSNKELIDMNMYPRGIYYVKVNQGGIVKAGKIVLK